MKIYKIGKGPLSLALGFGEITVTRYLDGQIPSKEYSDIMKAALSSPAYMKEKLQENRDKIAPTAYKKSMEAAIQLYYKEKNVAYNFSSEEGIKNYIRDMLQ